MKGLKILNIIAILLLACSLMSGQEIESALRLDKIEFEGLKKTKYDYLLRELKPILDKPIPAQKIEDDLIKLKNLPSVANAYYSLDTIKRKIKITYHIDERRTGIPIINFGGIKDNIWFSLGFIENNFRGNGDQLFAYYQNNNGLHSGEFFFRKPRIKSSDWGYSFSINKWSSQEPVFFDVGSVQYFYDNNGLGLSILRNLEQNNRIELGTKYFKESYNKLEEQELDNPPGPEKFSIPKFLTKLEIKSDYLQYHFFYLKGFESILNYQNVLNLNDNSWFNSVQFQGKLFLRPRDKVNIAIRFKLAISSNEDSPFAPFVADSHVNIRGIGNRIDRGTAQVVLNIESRHTILHHRYWSSQMVIFTDSGTWRNPGGDLSDIFNSSQFRQFVGLGFRINYQKVFGATLRVDYGIDLYNLNQSGIVIGLGQYF